MNWPTFFSTLLSSGVVIGAALFIVRRYVQHAIALRFTQLEEQTKAHIGEMTRRDAHLFDAQFEALKMANDLVYRARNAARVVAESPEFLGRSEQRRELEAFAAYHSAITELMYESRAIIPDDVFSHLHETKTIGQAFQYAAREYKRSKRNGDDDDRQLVDEIKRAYALLDYRYDALSTAVRSHLRTSTPT